MTYPKNPVIFAGWPCEVWLTVKWVRRTKTCFHFLQSGGVDPTQISISTRSLQSRKSKQIHRHSEKMEEIQVAAKWSMGVFFSNRQCWTSTSRWATWWPRSQSSTRSCLVQEAGRRRTSAGSRWRWWMRSLLLGDTLPSRTNLGSEQILHWLRDLTGRIRKVLFLFFSFFWERLKRLCLCCVARRCEDRAWQDAAERCVHWPPGAQGFSQQALRLPGGWDAHSSQQGDAHTNKHRTRVLIPP